MHTQEVGLRTYSACGSRVQCNSKSKVKLMILFQMLCALPLLCAGVNRLKTDFKYTQWGYRGRHRIGRSEFPWRSVTHGSQSA